MCDYPVCWMHSISNLIPCKLTLHCFIPLHVCACWQDMQIFHWRMKLLSQTPLHKDLNRSPTFFLEIHQSEIKNMQLLYVYAEVILLMSWHSNSLKNCEEGPHSGKKVYNLLYYCWITRINAYRQKICTYRFRKSIAQWKNRKISQYIEAKLFHIHIHLQTFRQNESHCNL